MPDAPELAVPATDARGPRTTPWETDRMPPGIPYIVGNEAAERFSFYGMKSILAVFMTKHLLDATGALGVMSGHESNYWQHCFNAAVYATPLLGAIVSDWLWGKYNTIIRLSLLYCAGHAVLALIDLPQATGIHPRVILFVGLALIAIGAGGIKPCVSAHVGDQFGPMNKSLIPRVFSWFYFSINLGSFFSTLLIPYLLDVYGAAMAFGIPGVLMAVATLAFWLGRNTFVHIPPAGKAFFKETFSPAGLTAIRNLAPLYLFVAMFWSLFDQTQSAWVLQAGQLDRFVFGHEINQSQIQAANPALVMVMIPLFTYVIYPLVNRVYTLTPLRKVGIGLLITPLSFALTGWVQMRIDAGQTPHLIWQLVAYVIMTAAEILVSITTLEFSYTQAPKKMKSFIMGVYMLSVTVGNLFTALVNYIIEAAEKTGLKLLEGANYYWFFTAAMGATAILYVIWSQFYRGRVYIQGEGENGE
jgi:POT family proton-dependent oligopeptide transporter